MTNNEFIACDMCNEIFNLRIQMGNYNIPFNIGCPNCMTKIKGIYHLENDTNNEIELTNAHIYEGSKEDFKGYCVELSAEFPTKKMFYRDLSMENGKLSNIISTPYIRNLKFYNSMESAIDSNKKAMNFADFFKEEWELIYSYFNLFWNDKFEILNPKLEEMIKKKSFLAINVIHNKMDSAMALHQILLMGTGLGLILPGNTIKEYSTFMKTIIKKDFENKNDSGDSPFLSFSNYLKDDYNEIEKKAFIVLNSFSKIYNQLIPIVSLNISSTYEKFDRENFGIMTADFDDMSKFYAQSYEWILDNLDIVIGLNNSIERGDFNKNFNDSGLENLKKLHSKYNKLDYVKQGEYFSKPLDNLKSKVRNAIQHYSTEIDYSNQKIVFIDRHHGNTNKEEIYLSDFASICLENFYFITYILELLYTLRKLSYISSGVMLSAENLKSSTPENTKNKRRKIGRNESCPCGSGIKYKKCHGRNKGKINE